MTSNYKVEILESNDTTTRFRLTNGEEYLSFEEVFNLWQNSSEFIKFHKSELIKINYQAFCWEHPAINKAFLDKKYECTLQRNKTLEQLPINENAFRKHIFKGEQVVDFMNLGKDARLVVPTKKTDEEIYNHFGKFLRLAEEQQVIEVFKRVGETILEEVEVGKFIWLNTAGLGVIWLHVRMDIRPKYYKTEKYKAPEFLIT